MGEQLSRQGSANDEESKRGHDLDAEADELLRGIESQTGSMYAVHAGDDAEEFDPGSLHADDLAQEEFLASNIAHSLNVDEPAEEPFAEPPEGNRGSSRDEAADAPADEPPIKEHRGLKRALVLIIFVLLLIICSIGVLVWHNSISPDIDQADTEALITSRAGTDQVEFQGLDSDEVPRLASIFGMKVAKAQKELGAQFQASGKATKSSDSRVKSMKRILEGSYLDKEGKAIASVGLGLDKTNRVVYAYVLYNLDTVEVASSSFAELVKSDVVPVSVLSGMGVEDAQLGTPQLDVDDSATERADFEGSTGAKKAPMSWAIAETYTYASDNATTRTLLAELW